MNKQLSKKLKQLPSGPGVYLHKDANGKIIYVGKAARLSNRVRQYFQPSRQHDTKTDLLVSQITNLDWIETESEIDALFLESELIKRYKPKYNIELRDDKAELFVRIDINSSHPTVSFSRRPLDDKAEYIGPFPNGGDLRQAMRILRKIFPYDTKQRTARKVSLDYHLGLSPGLEEAKTSLETYRANLKKLRLYLKGQRVKLISDIEKQMKQAAVSKQFELAAKLRDQLMALKSLRIQVVFGDKEFIDLSKDQALSGLAEIVGLPQPPKRIEGYDISHIQGQNNVASMVVFSSGLPDKREYRKFKMHTPGNDDFAHMSEVIRRRFSPSNVSRWKMPDLLLIDGGKGQLSAAQDSLDQLGVQLPVVALAKRWEELIIKNEKGFRKILLDKDSHALKLLIRIRDEAHRFAISYQSSLGRSDQVNSPLESISGIGPVTRKKLIKHFGSVKTALKADKAELVSVVGQAKAELLSMEESTKSSE